MSEADKIKDLEDQIRRLKSDMEKLRHQLEVTSLRLAGRRVKIVQLEEMNREMAKLINELKAE